MFSRSLPRLVVVTIVAVTALLCITSLTSVTARPTADLIVNPGESIQVAIDAANDGDTIIINAGTYTESLMLSKPVSLTGVNSATTIIHAVAGQRVLTVTGVMISNSVVISGLTFTGGHATLTNACANPCGGGLLLRLGAHPLIQNVIITDNQATYGGGLYSDHKVTLINTQFVQNTASASGGGLYVDVWDATVTMTDTQFINNHAGEQGGGAVVGVAYINGGRFEGNVGAGGYGGGGLSALVFFMTDTEFIGNTSFNSGAGAQSGRAFLNGGRFENNVSQKGAGGGLSAGQVGMTDTVFISNTSYYGGGGMYASPFDASIVEGRFENNRTTGLKHAEGGGLFVAMDGMTTIAQITATQFLSNVSSMDGGGLAIFSTSSSRSRIVNAVFTRNQAATGGAAISVLAGAIFDVLHTSISDEAVNSQAAISTQIGSNVAVTNTIIANHAIGISNTGGTVTEDYNLFYGNVTNTIGVTSGAHSLVGDPRFADSAHDDYHLAFGSAAIDRAVDAGVYTDLDGNIRPHGAGFDIGAYEYQGGARYVATTGDNTRNVCLDPAAPCATVQHAIDVAIDGDQILIASGTYSDVNVRPRNDITTTGIVTQIAYLSKTLTIRGGYTLTNWLISDPATNPTILDAQNQGRVFYIIGNISATLAGMHLTNGTTGIVWDNFCAPYLCQGPGGALYAVGATVNLTDSIVDNNGGGYQGAAIFIAGGHASLNHNAIMSNTAGGVLLFSSDGFINDNRIISNTAGNGGGILVLSGTATLLRNEILSNTANYACGGGVCIAYNSITTLDSNIIQGNTAIAYDGGGVGIFSAQAVLRGNSIKNNFVSSPFGYSDGGGVSVTGGRAELIGNTISNNIVSGNKRARGGGISIYNGSSIALTDNTIVDNVSTQIGGGIYLEGSGNTLSHNNLLHNHANSEGGGLYSKDAISLTDVKFISNTAHEGGGALLRGYAQIVNAAFVDNHSSGNGGGVMSGLYADHNMLALSNTDFISNSAAWNGGGLFANADVVIDKSRFVNNQVTGIMGDGGAILVNGTARSMHLLVTGTQFIGNSTIGDGGDGGAIYYDSDGIARITNGTFANNLAREYGAALVLNGHNHVTIINSTIADSGLNLLSAISIFNGASVNITNTIIAGHVQGIQRWSGSVTEDYNLFYGNVTNTIGVSNGAHSLVGDPRFIDPAHEDYHLAVDSAAIDHGVDAGVYTDLDGNARPRGLGFDIGAYEYQGVIYRAFLPVVRR